MSQAGGNVVWCGESVENNILKIIKRNLIGTSVGSLSDQVMLGLKNSGHRQPSIELPIPGPPVR